MKPNYNTIKQALYDKHPDVPPEEIDKIIKLYFDTLKEHIRNPQRPEISVLWGTLKLNFGKTRKRLETFEEYLDKLKRKEIINTKQKSLEFITNYYNQIAKIRDIYESVLKKGKTKRSYKRRKPDNDD